MKTQLLKSFIAFLIFNSVFLISAKAQIIYTDVNPDVTVNTNGGVYHLDLNNDSITDFNISIQTGSTSCNGTKPFAGLIITTTVLNRVASFSTSPFALTAGAMIGTITWNPNPGPLYMARDYYDCTSYQFLNHWGQWQTVYTSTHVIAGSWISTTDKYLGLKFTSGGNTYNGWARLNTQVTSNGTATFTIKDYVYNTIPNSLILAGQTPPTGITENFPSNHFSIYSFNKTLSIELNDATPLNGNINICNTLGQELKKIKIENRAMQIDISDCNSGIYFVSVQTNEAIETKKIFLK